MNFTQFVTTNCPKKFNFGEKIRKITKNLGTFGKKNENLQKNTFTFCFLMTFFSIFEKKLPKIILRQIFSQKKN